MKSWLELCTIGDLVVRGAARHGERDAIVFANARRTYAELDADATAFARSLIALGIRKGDRVGILMTNRLEYTAILVAAAYIGAIAVPINARYKARELAYVIENADIVVLVTTDVLEQPTSYVELLYDAFDDLAGQLNVTNLELSGAPELRACVLLGTSDAPGCISEADTSKLRDAIPEHTVGIARQRVALRDVAMMFYTSGTTAMPKGCALSHEAVVRAGIGTQRRLGYRDGDRAWNPLPMFHVGYTQILVAMFECGGAYVSMSRFDAAEALDLIERERVTVMFPAFPTITLALLNHPSYHPDRLKNVRSVFNVAPPDALVQMQAQMPHCLQVSGFGMTEFAGSVALTDPDDDPKQRTQTQGHPIVGVEIEIREPGGERSLPGSVGEIVVRGPSMFDGYHKDNVKTADTIDLEGWFRTGDLGTIDSHGRLVYQGRLKDMLKVGGENVAAIEIESYLTTHPAVNIAAVVGVPDAKYGEVAAAFIELKPGATATSDEIIAFCTGGMARFKVPHHVRFVTEWPMSATKIQKFQLRDIFADTIDNALSASEGSTRAPRKET